MRRWKQVLAGILCACMTVNLTLPAYADSTAVPVQTASNAEESFGDSQASSPVKMATDSNAAGTLLPGNGLSTAPLAANLTAVQPAAEVKINSIKILNKPISTLYLSVGDTYQLEVGAEPENATEGYTFSSNDETVLTVDSEGVITAVKPGSASVGVHSESYNRSDYMWMKVVEEAVTVTLHANGGTFSNGESTTKAYGEMGQTVSFYGCTPVMEGRIFSGNWYADAECTELVVDTTYFYPTEDMELYAGWTDAYTITYNYGGVTYNGKTSAVYEIPAGKNLGYSSSYPYFPTDPEQTGRKLFRGWQTEDGTFISKDNIYSYIPAGNEKLTAVWSDYYTIRFDYNGGKESSGDASEKIFYVIPGDRVANRPYISYEDESYILQGWATEDGEIYSENDVYWYVPQGNETLTAVWSQFYTITFDTNGGTFKYTSYNEPVKVPAGSKAQNLPTASVITKESAVFTGWRVEDTGELIVEYAGYTPTSDVTLVAQWAEYWTVTYDANGGSYTYDSYKSDVVEKGASVYLNSEYGYHRDGYKFAGWCTDPECTGKVLTGNYRPTADITLYAKWVKYYTITLDACGGKFSNGSGQSEMTVEAGKSLGYWNPSKAVKDGFSLEGWYVDEAYEKPVRSAYVPKGDETFYAKWLPPSESYIIRVHAGGPYYYDSSAGGYISETSFLIPAGSQIGYVRSPSRSGYQSSWFLDKDCTLPYDDKYVPEGDTDLYAKYVKEITISWDGNGGVDTTGTYRGRYTIGQGERASLSTELFKEGADFDGWYTLDGRKVSRATQFYEDTSVIARWTEGCRITLDVNGGMLTDNVMEKYMPCFYKKAGEALGVSIRPRREGYAFAGWKASSGKVYTSLNSAVVTGDTLFTAQWEKGVRLTLHAGEGGSIYNGYEKEYVTELDAYVSSKKAGAVSEISYYSVTHVSSLTFAGWSLTEGGPVLDLYECSFEKDTDLYAVWGESISVLFVLNGGMYRDSVSDYYVDSWESVKGEALTYPNDKYMSREGYTFAGWYETSDFTGEAIHIPDSNYVPAGNMFLYAKWIEGELEQYTVTFNTMGGSELEPQKVIKGNLLTAGLTPVKAGSVFKGWYLDEACLRKYDLTTPVYKDLTLYAGWTETTDLNDASIEVLGNYEYTGMYIIPDIRVKMGSMELTEGVDYMASYDNNLNAGTDAKIIITAMGEIYTGSKTVSFTIEKAESNVNIPEGLAAIYGEKLKDVIIPDGWEWKNPESSVGDAGEQKHEIVYHAIDANYKDKEGEATVSVSPRPIDGAYITLRPGSLIYTGNPVEPEFDITVNGTHLAPVNYEVKYEDNVNAGTAKLIVTGIGNYSGTVEKTFVIEKADPELAIVNPLNAEYGQTLSDVSLPKGWSWQDKDARTDSVGTMTFKADYTAPEGSNYKSKEGIDLRVTVAKRYITNADISIEKDLYVVTGSPIEPEVTITDTIYGTKQTLELGKDYKVGYWDNEAVGTAVVSVEGAGNYVGLKELYFKIIDDPYNIASAVISLNPEQTAYTGQAIEPAVTVSLGGKILTQETDYTVNYSNNVEPGLGRVTVTGTGTKGTDTYYGTKTAVFFINPVDYTLSAVYGDQLKDIEGKLPSGWSWQEPDAFVGNVTAEGAANVFKADYKSDDLEKTDVEFYVTVAPKRITDPTVKIQIQTDNLVYDPENPVEAEVVIEDTKLGAVLEAGTDYTLSYSDNTSAGNAGVRIEGINNYTGIYGGSYEIEQAESSPKLESEKLADGIIRLTIKDEPFFLYSSYQGDGTITFTSDDEAVFKVEKKENEIGNPNDGQITVTGVGEATLTISVSETGNYKGAELVYKVIVSRVSVQNAGIALDETSFVYTGSQIKPAVTVTVEGVTLTEGTDYTVSYGENVNAGAKAGTVTVAGMGDYEGTATAVFAIEKAENPAKAPEEALNAVYGQLLKEVALPETESGSWTWRNPEDYVGDSGIQTHEAVVAESQNYQEKTAQVTIHVAQKALTDDMVSLEYEETEYDGTEKTPSVSVKDGELATDADYTVSYSDNTEVGTGTVTVFGQNNYTGTVVKTFDITRAVIKANHVVLSGSWTYDGTQKKPEPFVTVHGRILTRDVDYTVAYGENIHPGAEAGTYRITGIGSYTGTVDKTFEIKKAENPAKEPDIKPTITYGQKLEDVALPAGWAWKNPEASANGAGTYTFIAYLAATEDYAEKTAEITVTVEPKALTADMVTVAATEPSYTGAAIEPAVTVKDAALLSEKDYVLTYENNIHAGTAAVIVTGAGNYKGTVRKTFVIKKAVPVLTVGAGTSVSCYLDQKTVELRAELSNKEALTYASSDETVASVNEAGLVTLAKTGTAEITVSYAGSADYEAVSQKVSLTVTRRSSGSSSSSGGSSGSSGGSGSGSSSSGKGYHFSSLPEGYSGATKIINYVRVPDYVESGSWMQEKDGSWKLKDGAQNIVKGRWVAAFNPYADLNAGQSAFDWFLFDGDGVMVTGWYRDEKGDYYYLNPVSDNTKGRMLTGWQRISGVDYYFNEKPDGTRGRLYVNTVTPDGWRVDENGARREKEVH